MKLLLLLLLCSIASSSLHGAEGRVSPPSLPTMRGSTLQPATRKHSAVAAASSSSSSAASTAPETERSGSPISHLPPLPASQLAGFSPSSRGLTSSKSLHRTIAPATDLPTLTAYLQQAERQLTTSGVPLTLQAATEPETFALLARAAQDTYSFLYARQLSIARACIDWTGFGATNHENRGLSVLYEVIRQQHDINLQKAARALLVRWWHANKSDKDETTLATLKRLAASPHLILSHRIKKGRTPSCICYDWKYNMFTNSLHEKGDPIPEGVLQIIYPDYTYPSRDAVEQDLTSEQDEDSLSISRCPSDDDDQERKVHRPRSNPRSPSPRGFRHFSSSSYSSSDEDPDFVVTMGGSSPRAQQPPLYKRGRWRERRPPTPGGTPTVSPIRLSVDYQRYRKVATEDEFE